MEYLRLALFGAGALIPVIFLLYLIISMVIRGNKDAILCMECDQCIKACPIARKFPGSATPKKIMAAAKTNNLKELSEAGQILCDFCGACELLCPRGLAPFKELERLKTNQKNLNEKIIFDEIPNEIILNE